MQNTPGGHLLLYFIILVNIIFPYFNENYREKDKKGKKDKKDKKDKKGKKDKKDKNEGRQW
jgi:hypothetical protein